MDRKSRGGIEIMLQMMAVTSVSEPTDGGRLRRLSSEADPTLIRSHGAASLYTDRKRDFHVPRLSLTQILFTSQDCADTPTGCLGKGVRTSRR